MLKPRILTAGEVCTELILKSHSLPQPGAKAKGDSFYYLPGGRGLLSSVALARLGADAVICARMGDDGNGADLAEYLAAESVDTRFLVKERGENTALTVCLQEPMTAERRLLYPGAAERMTDADMEEGFICYPDAVVLHGELTAQAYDKAVKTVREQKLPLFLVSLPDPDRYRLSRFEACEILTVDEDEVQRATGIRPSDQEKCMKACMALAQQIKARYVVLRLGERGCFLFDGLYYHFFSSYDVPQPSGVTSDEAFSAALVLEYLRSEGDIKRACEFATIVSAIYLTRGGGLRAYPSMEDVRRFIRRNEIDFTLE